ncbi:pyridoxamine 5'-phosphate oxidase family protein [Plantactinospora sp. KBS50]|uniref:pyridoxamine 5'-phosphate oxidase family protein n=1 Tax=Plantactinospora sp. KBS50 TaxID=2024580 RepID=UPI000BAB18DA|nr:pyridoxamine 5'-phosphate oxidase family protein [Plantactinospora sp. KBS50]ASW54878.1 flavin-nucleotide-binding protein [Plantactinospora sp. KBS50]
MSELSATPRTTLRRGKEKGRAAREDLFAVLRAAFVCHLGVTVDGAPMVVPTVYGFDDDHLYLHGSVASRSLSRPEATVCVTVTVVDGVVLARSMFEHSVNYRSAMIYGTPRVLADPQEKLDALRIVSEHVTPGQWDYARRPSRKELAATTMLAVPLAEASVKMRGGPPDDADSPDAALGLWAGELPLRTVWQEPVPDPALTPPVPPPPHVLERVRAG